MHRVVSDLSLLEKHLAERRRKRRIMPKTSSGFGSSEPSSRSFKLYPVLIETMPHALAKLYSVLPAFRGGRDQALSTKVRREPPTQTNHFRE